MKIYITLLLIITSRLLFAQSPNWLWAKSGSGNNADDARSAAVDIFGNSYVVGSFRSSTITFDTISLACAGGLGDVYVVKYNPNGNVLWARRAGGTNLEYAVDVTTDNSGNCFVTGQYDGISIIFGTDTLTGPGNGAMFIVKYDANGNVFWVKGSGGHVSPRSIAVDASGNCFVTGYFGTTTTIDTATLYTSGIEDMYVAKFDPSGNLLWVNTAGGSAYDNGRAVAADAFGNCLVTGDFNSSAFSFGTDTLFNSGASGGNMFIAKYDMNGILLWTYGTGGNGADYAYAIAADNSGNVFAAGFYGSDSITFDTTTLTRAAGIGVDMYLVKCDGSGNVLWAKGAGGNNNDETHSIGVDAFGSCYVTGSFASSTINFGPFLLTNTSFGYDLYIVKYDPNGNAVWAKQAGGNNNEYTYCSAVDAAGDCYVAGFFNSPSLTFGSTTLTNTGDYDIFIAKLDHITNVNKIESNSVFSVFPNPAATTISFLFQKQNVNHASITIRNVLGQALLNEQEESPDKLYAKTIDVSFLSNGIYFLDIIIDETRTVRMFVKE